MARLVIDQITTVSFIAYVTELDTNYSRDDRLAYWYLNGSLYTVTSLGANIYTSGLVLFANLTSNTFYSVEAQLYYKNSASDTNYQTVSVYGSCMTQAPPRPAYFSWTYAKTSGATFNLLASEWNALTANINLVRQYKGLGLFNFTTAYSGNDVMAYMYNECLYAMEPMYVGWNLGNAEVSSGDDITASDLNYLVTLVNGI